jgi:hypothetical protein
MSEKIQGHFNTRYVTHSSQWFVEREKKAFVFITLHYNIRGKAFFTCGKRKNKTNRISLHHQKAKMSSWDAERTRKLNEQFNTVYREHDRLHQDLSSDQRQRYQSLFNTIDKWEEDAIKKIEKTAGTARNDLQRLLDETNHQLQRSLNDTVTEELREALQKANNYTEFHIDRWMAYLSEIRKQLETISSTVDFSQHKVINLIKVKRNFPIKTFGKINLDDREFQFEKIRGHPILYNTEHLISSARPAIILSRNNYATGTHYFRFRIENTTNELFFGIISAKDDQKLKKNIHPIQSIYGWWNIDRRVIGDRKEPYVSSLNILNGDEVILMLNCDAREIFLEYPSMSKLNSLQLSNDIRECPSPWKLLIEIGKPGKCLLRLLEWGVIAHGTNRPERRLHCFCSPD